MRFNNEFTPESHDFSIQRLYPNRWLSVAEASRAKSNRWLSVAEASSLTNKVHNLVVKLLFGVNSVIINLS